MDRPDGRFRELSPIGSKRCEIMLPDDALRCRTQSLHREGLRHMPGQSDLEGMKHALVPDPVPVHLSRRSILGVKMRTDFDTFQNADLVRQVRVQRCDPGSALKLGSRDIYMSYLTERVNTGICPACSKHFNGEFEDPRERSHEVVLNTLPIRLALPPAERPAIIGNSQFQAF